MHMARGFGSALQYLEYLSKISVPWPRKVQHEAIVFVIFSKIFDFSENLQNDLGCLRNASDSCIELKKLFRTVRKVLKMDAWMWRSAA